MLTVPPSVTTSVTRLNRFQTNLDRKHTGAEISRLGSDVQNQFRVDARNEGSAAVVEVSGELDLASGPELEAVLERLAAEPTELLIIDLRQVEFMDSTGLSIIVKAHQKFADDGRRLALVKGPSQVQRLLDLTGVADRLQLVDAPEELLSGG
jgi:anti-sigma B factor antagonist